MSKNIKLFISALLIYIILDVAYNLLVGMRIDHHFLKEAGILSIYNEKPAYSWTIALFFIIISYANFRLAILPAVALKDIVKAVRAGLILGVAAYATLALPLLWSIKNYPVELVVIHIVGGGLLSLATSALTTTIYLKCWDKA